MEVNEIKKSVAKLERKGTKGLWLQFLIFPLILGVMGFWFQNSIQESENKMQRLKMTQAILGDIFTDTIYERTVAMKSIIYEILNDEKIANKISSMVDAHLSKTAKESDLTQFNKVLSAIENYSKPGNTLLENLKTSDIVISKLNKTQMAKRKEREALIT
ncbi:hypothetical protein SAMN04488514_10684 [Kriegella aquimaris]|uniref:Uncharacterized protein n=2 Tax=Kriegella aquimaris TaxID=192904 RepID=A0A1G9RCT6_9FLAO|nr:hypothetical protein SAMN04488514_10684 [Kriegella aquimaris]